MLFLRTLAGKKDALMTGFLPVLRGSSLLLPSSSVQVMSKGAAVRRENEVLVMFMFTTKKEERKFFVYFVARPSCALSMLHLRNNVVFRDSARTIAVLV